MHRGHDGVAAGMWLYRLTRLFKPLIRPCWRIGLEGSVDAIPRSGPLIVCPNHTSFLDPLFVGHSFPREIHFLITDEWYFKSPLWTWLFRAYGGLPQAKDPHETIATVCEVLERGAVVGVFPEGGISKDGRLQRVRTGIARMALRSGAPVLPLGIHGAFEILPRTRRVPRRGRVRLLVDEPLVLPGSPSACRPALSDLYEFRDLLTERLAALVAGSADEAGAPLPTDQASGGR